jgi:hypothetical protein
LQTHSFVQPIAAAKSTHTQPVRKEETTQAIDDETVEQTLARDVALAEPASLLPHLALPMPQRDDVLRQDGSVRKVTIAQLHTRLHKVSPTRRKPDLRQHLLHIVMFYGCVPRLLTVCHHDLQVVRQPVVRRAAVALNLRQTTKYKKEDFDLAWFAGVKDVAATFFANKLSPYPHRIVNRFPRVREALGKSNFSRLMEALYQVQAVVWGCHSETSHTAHMQPPP